MLILVAEDNPENRDMLVRRLTRKGFEVIEAVDGIEAVEIAAKYAPTLVLMDLSMPRRNGLEATRDIRAACNGAGPRIIALTANAMASARDECMAAGCDAFATKPVDFPALLGLIDRVCGPQGAAA
jgi:two-component system, cell cycle response regulator DivK